MTITPIYPRRLKENIIPAQARDLVELIRRGLESGRFAIVDGTIVLKCDKIGGENVKPKQTY